MTNHAKALRGWLLTLTFLLFLWHNFEYTKKTTASIISQFLGFIRKFLLFSLINYINENKIYNFFKIFFYKYIIRLLTKFSYFYLDFHFYHI